jgi:hypothetical protein
MVLAGTMHAGSSICLCLLCQSSAHKHHEVRVPTQQHTTSLALRCRQCGPTNPTRVQHVRQSTNSGGASGSLSDWCGVCVPSACGAAGHRERAPKPVRQSQLTVMGRQQHVGRWVCVSTLGTWLTANSATAAAAAAAACAWAPLAAPCATLRAP